MTIHVRLFAAVKQNAGRETVEVVLSPGATIADLRRALAEQLPELTSLFERSLFAIGTEYAAENTVITANSDVACIPPVSGG